jgi:hypothetical protein
MSFVLKVTDLMHCPHGGTVQITGAPKLRVGGTPVLLVDDVSNQPIVGCPPVPNATPCTFVGTASGGAKKLTVGTHAVALDGLASKTNGKVSGVDQVLLPTVASQFKLSAAPQ